MQFKFLWQSDSTARSIDFPDPDKKQLCRFLNNIIFSLVLLITLANLHSSLQTPKHLKLKLAATSPSFENFYFSAQTIAALQRCT